MSDCKDQVTAGTNAPSEWQSNQNPMLEYYDSDFPSALLSRYPENFDATTVSQGLAHDVARYLEIAARENGEILELCCGTGRVAIPLALQGSSIAAVDFSDALLETLRENIERVAPDAGRRIEIIHQDVTGLDLEKRQFKLAIMAFNSLLCIPDFAAQRKALASAARHLVKGGLLVLDLINPLSLAREGNPIPTPFFTRRHPRTGRRYTRFAMLSPFDAAHVQRLHGWYDEYGDDGVIRRRPYETLWRPIHRFEIELMLEVAGFAIEGIDGGHQHEVYSPASPRMFVSARKR